MKMAPKIMNIRASSGHKLVARFKNGKIRELDLTRYLNKGVFRELKNEQYFKKVRSIGIGVEWPRQQDLSAETLYFDGRPVKKFN